MRKRNDTSYPETRNIILALCFATALSLTFVYQIKNVSGLRPYLFLFWDTFLAWVPVILSLLLDVISDLRQRTGRRVLLVLIGAAWFFFYPNAPYLVTDLLHVFIRYHTGVDEEFWLNIEFWKHLLSLFSVSMLGILLGSYSLYRVHRLVKRSFGGFAGWFFAVLILLLSSFGIFIGRFIRWNSWDVVTRPLHIVQQTYLILTERETVHFIILFCKFMFPVLLTGYLISYFFIESRKKPLP